MSRKRKNLDDELEPTVKLTSDGDLLVKNLLEKQLSTQSNLQTELHRNKIFVSSTEYKPISDHVSGINSLQDLKRTSQYLQISEDFKAAGLNEDDVDFYLNAEKGMEYLKTKHKNLDPKQIEKRLFDIKEIFHNYNITKNIQDSSENAVGRLQTECMLSMKPNSLETNLLKFALSNDKKISSLCNENASLSILEKEFMSSMDNKLDNMSIPKLQKKVQRRLRSMSKRVDSLVLSSEKLGVESSISLVKFKTKYAERKSSVALPRDPDIPQVKNSKWDIQYEDSQPSETKEQHTIKSHEKGTERAQAIAIVNSELSTSKTQASGNRYTIKNGTIIKLEKQVDYTQNEKLSVEEIRNIPKFSQYTTGSPSKILYLKNTHSLNENDLRQLFKSFNFETKDINVLKGKMRGQAFVEMEDCQSAEQALSCINGIVVKNKPVIIQFSTKTELKK